MRVPALPEAECSVLELSAGGVTMAAALHLLPVFLLCGYFALVPARSDGDVSAARGALSTTGGSPAGTEAPTSSQPGKSNTIPRHLSGK